MGCYSKAVLLPDPSLNGPDRIICKLNDSAAVDTSEVAMMFVAIDTLIVEMAVLEIDLFNQTAVNEEGDGPVEGGLGNPLLLVSQPQEEFIDVEVIVDGEDFLNDRLPLRGVSHPLFLNIFPKFLDSIHGRTIFIEIHYQ
jgi:hypothetical protein